MDATASVTVELAPDAPVASAAEWDQLVRAAGGGVFHTSAWLRAYERAGPHRSRACHLVAKQNGCLVGLLPCYVTADCPRLAAARRHLVSQPTWLEEPMLLAHSLYAYYGGPIAKAGTLHIVEALVGAFGRLAADMGVSVHGFINVPETQLGVLEVLQRSGYLVTYSSSCMVLPSRWGSFEDYLGSLPGKRRRLIRAMQRKSERGGVLAELVSRPPNLASLIELEAGVLRHHGHRAQSYFPEPYLKALMDELAEGVRFLLVRTADGTPCLFFLILDNSSCLTPWVAGIDYSRLHQDEPYHLAYRWLIRHAIERGYREIDMGRGSYRFKARYGFCRRVLYLALSTSRTEYRGELERWSTDLGRNQQARYDREFSIHDAVHVSAAR